MGQKIFSKGGGFGESKVTSTASPEELPKTWDDGKPSRDEWAEPKTEELHHVPSFPISKVASLKRVEKNK